MPSTSAIEAGRAFLRLMVEDKEFKRGVDHALRRVNQFGKSIRNIGLGLGAAGTAITAPFVASLKVFSDVGSKLYDVSQRTGISVQHLSELKYAAEQSGSSLDALARAARNMQQKGFDPRRFDEIMSQLAAIEDPVMRAQKAMEIFGSRSGAELIPLLENLPALRKEARDLGLTMNDTTAAAADRLGDALGKLKSALLGISNAIAEQVAPHVTAFMEGLTSTVPAVLVFIQNNEKLIKVVFAVGAGLTVAAGAITAFSAVVLTGAALVATIGAKAAIAAVAVGTLSGAFTAGLAAIVDYKKALGQLNDTLRVYINYQKLLGLLRNLSERAPAVPDAPKPSTSDIDTLRPTLGTVTTGGNVNAGLFQLVDIARHFLALGNEARIQEHRKHTLNSAFGDPSVIKQRQKIADDFFGNQGTFSGKFASQILGQPANGVTNLLQKQIQQNDKANRLLESIDRLLPKAIGRGISIGVA
jgi:hypothetical protein